ncbi:DUF5667 domain-containing protein [Neobacillus sp. NRS-1170]|uniref:DUF5667 domain-containing protein n=1 Tax=Neobacillus sp. NRS-1170 TaxID=3233898 RepID=UPI003D264F12
MKNRKISSLITSGMLASTLIFSFGAGSAFASGDGTEATTDTAVTTDQVQNGTNQTDSEVTDQEKVETPSLVPGDFFYFVKTMTEKIQLAFTFDDYKQAELLADFASERIAEANALFAEGKTEDAAAILKEALATQEEASQTLPATEEGTEADSSDNTQSVEEGKVEVKLAHNIDALCAALAQVKNPTAQHSIMKNVQKSFAKLAKKAAKLEEKDAKFAKKMSEIEDKVASGEMSEDEAARAKSKLEKKQHKHDEEATEPEKVEQESTEAKQDQDDDQQEEAKSGKVNHSEAANKTVEKQQEAAKRAEANKQEAAKKAQEQQQEAAKKSKENKQEEAKKDGYKKSEKADDNNDDQGENNDTE